MNSYVTIKISGLVWLLKLKRKYDDPTSVSIPSTTWFNRLYE